MFFLFCFFAEGSAWCCCGPDCKKKVLVLVPAEPQKEIWSGWNLRVLPLNVWHPPINPTKLMD